MIGKAIKIARIATGDIDEKASSAAAELGRRGGKTRAENMTPERRKEIAQKAAATRWKNGVGS